MTYEGAKVLTLFVCVHSSMFVHADPQFSDIISLDFSIDIYYIHVNSILMTEHCFVYR